MYIYNPQQTKIIKLNKNKNNENRFPTIKCIKSEIVLTI